MRGRRIELPQLVVRRGPQLGRDSSSFVQHLESLRMRVWSGNSLCEFGQPSRPLAPNGRPDRLVNHSAMLHERGGELGRHGCIFDIDGFQRREELFDIVYGNEGGTKVHRCGQAKFMDLELAPDLAPARVPSLANLAELGERCGELSAIKMEMPKIQPRSHIVGFCNKHSRQIGLDIDAARNIRREMIREIRPQQPAVEI